MIVRPETAQRSETPEADRPRVGHAVTLHLSDTGGLTQFGAHLQTLDPAATTGERHWHSGDEEFLYVTEGAATVIDNDGAHELHAGDAAVWRAGVPNAHRVENRSDAPCRYLIVGTRILRDICTYPDSGRRQMNYDSTWEILAADGTRIKGGDLPPQLLNLRADWTPPAEKPWPHPAIVRRGDARTETATPEQIAALGGYSARLYSDTGGLAQFGAFTETLDPGALSSHRHWHENEDEFLYMLDGEATLIEDDGEHGLKPGDACCWPAGVPNAHRVANRSGSPCTYLIVGTRLPDDTVHYAEVDRLVTKRGGVIRRTRRDGSPLG